MRDTRATPAPGTPCADRAAFRMELHRAHAEGCAIQRTGIATIVRRRFRRMQFRLAYGECYLETMNADLISVRAACASGPRQQLNNNERESSARRARVRARPQSGPRSPEGRVHRLHGRGAGRTRPTTVGGDAARCQTWSFFIVATWCTSSAAARSLARSPFPVRAGSDVCEVRRGANVVRLAGSATATTHRIATHLGSPRLVADSRLLLPADPHADTLASVSKRTVTWTWACCARS